MFIKNCFAAKVFRLFIFIATLKNEKKNCFITLIKNVSIM